MKRTFLTKRTLLATVAAAALALGVTAWSASGANAHGTGPGTGTPGVTGMMGQGPGMMGTPGTGYGKGYGKDCGYGAGYGMGMMGGYGGYGHMGSGLMGGFGSGGFGADNPLTVDQVKTLLEARLIMHGNNNLKIGKIEAKDADTIIAEIVTKDGSLVQKVEFQTKTGQHHPVN